MLAVRGKFIRLHRVRPLATMAQQRNEIAWCLCAHTQFYWNEISYMRRKNTRWLSIKHRTQRRQCAPACLNAIKDKGLYSVRTWIVQISVFRKKPTTCGNTLKLKPEYMLHLFSVIIKKNLAKNLLYTIYIWKITNMTNIFLVLLTIVVDTTRCWGIYKFPLESFCCLGRDLHLYNL